MTELMHPSELKKITDDADMEEAKLTMNYLKKQEEEHKRLFEVFKTREIHPEVKERINAAVRRAAEAGHNEIEVVVFSSDYCNDSGRRINNNEPDWPDSLEGFARKAYEYYEKELRPLGYKINAQVINYPGGMPGDIRLSLKW